MLMIFTPTWRRPDGELAMHPDCKRTVEAQVVTGGCTWLVGLENPYAIGNTLNILHQYQVVREKFLNSDAAALLLVEHDNVLPDQDAAQRLLDTASDVVYGVYMFRHGTNVINAYRYEGDRNLGQSISLYPGELERARQQNVVRVSGCGFGCTLIRRHVVERIAFRMGDPQAYAPDVPFAQDALRLGYVSAARFDVQVGHYHQGIKLEPFGKRGPMVRVIAQQSINVLVDGQVLRMVQGRTYAVSEQEANDLSRANYAQIVAPELATGVPESATMAPPAGRVLPTGRKRSAS